MLIKLLPHTKTYQNKICRSVSCSKPVVKLSLSHYLPPKYLIKDVTARPPQIETVPARIFRFFMCLRRKTTFSLVPFHF